VKQKKKDEQGRNNNRDRGRGEKGCVWALGVRDATPTKKTAAAAEQTTIKETESRKVGSSTPPVKRRGERAAEGAAGNDNVTKPKTR
jgi:hypothetical protein